MKPAVNPFVPIPQAYRILLLGYFAVYLILIPTVTYVSTDAVVPYSGARYALLMVYHLLLFVPIIFYRPSYGLLHPLVFPLLLGIVKVVAKSFDSLLAFLNTTPLFLEVNTAAAKPLRGLSQGEISELEIYVQLLEILAISGMYLGYFYGPAIRSFRLPTMRSRNLPWVVGPAIVLSVMGTLLYLQSKGGITAHFTSFAMGRKSAVGDEGFIHVAMGVGFTATLVWLACRKHAYRNPLFWAAVVLTVPIQFLLRGSRSTIVYSAILLFLVHMLRTRKLPTVRIALVGFVGLMLIGVLGEVRKSSFGGNTVNWSILTNLSVDYAVEAYNKEITFRTGQQPELAVMARAVEDEGLLWGKTYLGGILFFVPRALWPDKPHSIGYYTGTLLYNSRGGIPPSSVMEAYWNFHVPGVLVVFFLFGTCLQWFGRLLVANADNPAFYVIYVILVFYFGPSYLALVTSFQQLGLALLVLWLARLIPPVVQVNSLYRI